MSSGTTGKPVVAGYTRHDIEIWSEVTARALTMAGTTKMISFRIAMVMDFLQVGLEYIMAHKKIGATVVPASAGNTRKQIEIMRDLGTTILTCTPSYALYLAEVAQEIGIPPTTLKLKAGSFGAEIWTEQMRNEIEKRF